MIASNSAKLERVIEAVRLGLEGDAAVEFVRQSGFAMTSAGLARRLRTMGGRGSVQEFVEQGLSNWDILRACVPDAEIEPGRHEPPPSQEELFPEEEALRDAAPPGPDHPLYDTVKLTVKVPSEVYEALRLAAKGEGKTMNELASEILTAVLARMPAYPPEP